MADGTSTDRVADDGTGARGAGTATVEDLYSDLRTLTSDEEDAERREEVLDIKHLLAEAHQRGLIDSGVRHLDARDAAEAFVGSVIFASPLLVEDGIFDIGEYLFEFSVSGVPLFLVANTVFVVVMTYAMLEWTGRNRDESHVLFGVVPVRVVMILAISFVVATVLMTVWGRVAWLDSPVEAIARVNVLWTVGSLGAALGDILADDDPERPPAVGTEATGTAGTAGKAETTGTRETTGMVGTNATAASTDGDRTPASSRYSVEALTDGELLAALHREFDDLESAVDDAGERRDVNQIREQTVEASLDDTFGDEIRKYTGRDIAEAFVGSIFFAIPFLVEDGVFDVADYFLSFNVGFFPVFFLVNTAFVLVMILALVYWAGPQDVQVSRPILGFVPRRLVGISIVSFLTAAALMTMWGRVDGWQDPVVALARISVVWTVASFGAALGDILPGESSGDDINDDLAALSETAFDQSGPADSET